MRSRRSCFTNLNTGRNPISPTYPMVVIGYENYIEINNTLEYYTCKYYSWRNKYVHWA